MSKCPTCNEIWSGSARCHCTSCHKTFNSLGAFDKHRKAFKCIDPETLGMQMNEKGIWSTPFNENFKTEHGRTKNMAL